MGSLTDVEGGDIGDATGAEGVEDEGVMEEAMDGEESAVGEGPAGMSGEETRGGKGSESS